MPLTLTVNGTTHNVESDPTTPLLYVLRDELGLNGPQYGCGQERCGACAVLVGAKAAFSCHLPVGEVGRAAVTTLEGLPSEGELHPVQQAFIELQAAQCGYCSNGMVIAAAALLWKTPQPSDAQIREALDGHLCRCGSHLRILQAVRRAGELLGEAGRDETTEVPTADGGRQTIDSLGEAAESGGRAASEGLEEAPQRSVPVVEQAIHRVTAEGPQKVDDWIAIEQDGGVTAYSGKVELGTGVRTALAQIVAEELDVPFERINMVMGDTSRTPDEGVTAGSMTIKNGGDMLRQAAAEARLALLEQASERLDANVDELAIEDGVVIVAQRPERRVSLGVLMGGRKFERVVSGNAPLKPVDAYRVVGASQARVDLPLKLTGHPSFIQDLRLPGMRHGRMVPPPQRGAQLVSVDQASLAGLPGQVQVVVRGNFVGVVAEQEAQAVQAAKQLNVTWRPGEGLPAQADLYTWLRAQPGQTQVVAEMGDVDGRLAEAAQTLNATYCQPFHAHASIGPSCAVADVRDGQFTVWCSTQGPYPLRGALAELLGTPLEQVQVVHKEGAGCYGQNGADDVAAMALLLAQAVGWPVRLQWSRAMEFAWEPKSAAMVIEMTGGLDATGNITAWEYGAWTPTHTARPRRADQLLAAQWVAGHDRPQSRGFGGGDRNAATRYDLPDQRVTMHWLTEAPLHTSSFRALGGTANTFANESFMDELAAAAGADPVAFRLRHLSDARLRAVLLAAAERAGWEAHWAAGPRANTGLGVACAQYKNSGAYVATVAEVSVDRESGGVRVERIVVAHDCGLIINPDGVRHQIEGNVLQSLSRALKEEVRFDEAGVTSLDWATYPILTFSEVPGVEIVLIDRPDQPSLGAGEPATVTTAPAVANAIYAATGARVRQVPFTPARVRAAMDTRTD